MLFELRKDLENAADMVNQIEVIRSQLAGITALLNPAPAETTTAGAGTAGVGTAGASPASSSATVGAPPASEATGSTRDYAAIKRAADDLDKKLTDVEDNLIQRRLTGQGQDSVRFPPKLVSKISYLANGIAGADFQPTTQQREVKIMFEEQLTAHRRRLDEILSKDLDAFNKLLRDRGIGNVIVKQ